MYEDLEKYQGEKIRCENPSCRREFTEGEVITVADDGRVFCYTGERGGCLFAYVVSTGQVFRGNVQAMRFRGSKYREPANPTPNYPNMPVGKKKEDENESWLRELLDGLEG